MTRFVFLDCAVVSLLDAVNNGQHQAMLLRAWASTTRDIPNLFSIL